MRFTLRLRWVTLTFLPSLSYSSPLSLYSMSVFYTILRCSLLRFSLLNRCYAFVHFGYTLPPVTAHDLRRCCAFCLRSTAFGRLRCFIHLYLGSHHAVHLPLTLLPFTLHFGAVAAYARLVYAFDFCWPIYLFLAGTRLHCYRGGTLDIRLDYIWCSLPYRALQTTLHT